MLGGGGSWQKPQQPQEAENIRINGKATSKHRHPPSRMCGPGLRERGVGTREELRSLASIQLLD